MRVLALDPWARVGTRQSIKRAVPLGPPNVLEQLSDRGSNCK